MKNHFVFEKGRMVRWRIEQPYNTRISLWKWRSIWINHANGRQLRLNAESPCLHSIAPQPDDFGAMLAFPVSNHHSSLQTQHFLSTPSLTPYTSMPLSNEDLSSYNRNQSIRRRKNKPFGNHVDNSMNHSKSLYRTYIIPDNISISAWVTGST